MNRDTIRFRGKETKPNATYEVYSADNAEDAKAFLETKTVNQGKYYILVETPEGVWGTDMHGLYLERLLPFQTRIETANCEGHICLTPAAKNVEMAARGLVESFVVGIKCGACSHEWKDALRYQKDTVVRCPKCKGFNKVGSGNVRVLFIKEQAQTDASSSIPAAPSTVCTDKAEKHASSLETAQVNWYFATSEQKKVRQIVLQASPENEVAPRFGALFLSNKFVSLLTNTWATGFFYLDSDPGPFLMVRADRVASKLRGSSVTVAICFYRMKAGGFVTIYVYVDCPAVAKMLNDPIVLFENSYGLDYENRGMKEIIERAIAKDALHICFTEGDGPAIIFPDSRGFESKGIESKFDVVIPLGNECRTILRKEYDSLLGYHENIPFSIRNYKQSVQQMWTENPQGINPILPCPANIGSNIDDAIMNVGVDAPSVILGKPIEQLSVEQNLKKSWWQFWK